MESVPHAAPEQPAPESAQVTPLFCESFWRVAVKFCVPIPVWTLGSVGAIVTTMTGFAVTVIVALKFFVVSAMEVAVNVTEAGEGIAAGAVYVTEVVVTLERAPQVAPEHPAPVNVQVTPLFCESF